MAGNPADNPEARGGSDFPRWLGLDNTAKIWPAIRSRRYTTIFRLGAVLDHRILIERLQQALQSTLERYPYFKVAIRRGLFWYHLEPRQDLVPLEADSINPCMNHRVVGRGTWPLRLRVYNNRLALEMSHILSDGTGAMKFLQYLLECYFECSPSGPALPDPLEWQDCYPGMMLEDGTVLPRIPRRERAWHPPGQLLPLGEYRICAAWCPVDRVLDMARSKSLSLTAFLATVILYCLQEQQQEILQHRGKLQATMPLVLNVPVNLRRYFPAVTMRNFFSNVEPEIDPRLGLLEFDEIALQVQRQMEFQLNPRRLRMLVTRNMRGERNVVNRLTPRFLKDLVLNHIYRSLGDRVYSASFSNLGVFPRGNLPQQGIRGISFLPPPSPVCPINVSCISWDERLYLGFAGLLDNMDLARRVCRWLSGAGCSPVVESNMPVGGWKES